MKELLKNLIDTKTINYDKQFNKIAKIHKYWSRKPYHLIENCINTYSKPNDTVLDTFCGSGSVGLECLLNNRKFIGYDLNPTAIFVTENTLNLDFNIDEFEKEIQLFDTNFKTEIMKLYELSENNYILYLIGGKTIKNYNTVICDINFNKKSTANYNGGVFDKNFELPENLVFPDKYFPKKFYKDRFSYKGISKVSDFFSKRNLYAIALLYNFIQNESLKYKNLFLLAFSNTLLHVSKLKAENVRPLSVNNYWIPDDFIEENVLWRFLDRVENIKTAKELILKRKRQKQISKNSEFTLFNKSSLELSELENQSIDYLITDPPYGDAIQYSELSFIWNCWLEKEFDIEQEVIINPVQNKGINEFQNQILLFIKNAKRVLKPDAFFTLCFQNKDVKIWLEIIQNIKKQGFILHDIKIYDTFGSPYNKHWAKFSPKSDLYVTFQNAEKETDNNFQTIEPQYIIKEIMTLFKNNTFDLYKAYDLFVASVIQEVFKGKEIKNIDNWNLKKIIELFEKEEPNGNQQKRNTTNIQSQLQF